MRLLYKEMSVLCPLYGIRVSTNKCFDGILVTTKKPCEHFKSQDDKSVFCTFR